MKIRIFAMGILLFLLGCGKVPTTEPNQSFGHFTGDFESGHLKNFHYLLVDTNVNTIIVNNPVRKGNFALKNVLLPTDFVNHGHRTELAIYDCAKYKTEVFYGFSFMIDTSYSELQYNLICQWQDLPYYEQGENWEPDPNIRGSSPPLALVYANGMLEIKMNENPMSNKHTYTVGNPQAITKGQWYDVVAHIYWSDDNSGYCEFWLNGNVITPGNGNDNKFYKRNLFNRAGNYFKFGQYRGKDMTSHNHVVYFDEVKIGSSYNEVAP